MAAKTGTYTLISSNVLGSAAASVTFSSIPNTYTDLIIVTQAISATADDVGIRFNSDSGSNYSQTWLSGNGTSAFSSRYSSSTSVYLDIYGSMGTSLFNNTNVQIMDYANTTTYKTFLSRSNRAGSGVDAIVGLWRSTAAISTIVLAPTTGVNFSTGSTFKLYGIEAAK
jgi:hypothetical protein